MRGRWRVGLAFALLSLLLAGTMWVVPYIPTNDGPEWVFASHVESHYADPGTNYAEALIPASQFASRGFTPLLTFFEGCLGWEAGLQAALSVTVLFEAWAFVALVCAIDRRRWALGFLGFPLALSWELYMGLWAFVVSTAVGLTVLALAVRLPAPTWRARAVISLALLANAVAHVFGAVLTGGALLLLSLARAGRGRRMAELARVGVTGAPAAGVLAACLAVGLRQPRSALARNFERLPWSDALAILPRTVAPGPLARALLVTVAVAAAAVVAVVRAKRRGTDAVDRGLGLGAALLLLLGVLAPFQIPGWQAFSQRFVPLGVALAVAVMPLERLPSRAQRVAPWLLFVLASTWLGATYPFHTRLAALCPDALAGLTAPVRLAGAILPVTIRTTELPVYDRVHAEVPLMAPLRHMGALYAAAHGGVPVSTFAGNPAIDPFVIGPLGPRRPMPDTEHYLRAISSPEYHHDLGFRRDVDGELASFGAFYDETVVVGALPEDLAVWRERGFVADWAGGATLVAHFEPCTIDFTTPVAAAEPPPTFDIRVGKIGLVKDARTEPSVEEDGLAHFALAPAPCGLVTVHARWDSGANGAALVCRNADASGDLVARVSRTAHRVTCEGR